MDKELWEIIGFVLVVLFCVFWRMSPGGQTTFMREPPNSEPPACFLVTEEQERVNA